MDAWRETILENAEYHTRLVSTIAELEYVPLAAKHQVGYVKDLESQILTAKRKVTHRAEDIRKARMEYEALRDSTVRRLALSVFGKKEKYAAMESKLDRQYILALEREVTARDNFNVVTQLLEEANKLARDLEEKGMRYEAALAELQVLYGRVFDRPAQYFPEDGRLKHALEAASEQHEKAQWKRDSEIRAAELLARAVKAMELCQLNIEKALTYTEDKWRVGSIEHITKQNALRDAKANESRVEPLVDQAMRLSPMIRPIGRVHITQVSNDEGAFIDTAIHELAVEKTKQSEGQLISKSQKLRAESESAKRRADTASTELKTAARELNARKSELDGYRRATFESYVAPTPPPYEF